MFVEKKHYLFSKKYLYVIIFFLLLMPEWTDAATVQAFVDRTHVILGESVQLTISVSDGDGVADVSLIKDFKVISKGTSTNLRIVNNTVSREASHIYTLIPLKEGKLRIPQLPVTCQGELYHTQEIVVHVSETSAAQRENSHEERNIFLEAQLSDENPYEGEQVIYTLKFYNAVRIKNARFQSSPEFPGFSVRKIEEDKSYRTTISGQVYHVTELTYVLIPLNPGEKRIESVIVGCDVVRSRSRRRGFAFDSLFNDPYFTEELEAKAFSTEPIQVNVKPLPGYDGPGRFSGLVGEFQIQTELEPSSLQVGESATLSVTISGNGNLMDVEAPEVPVPDEFKVYKDNPEEAIHLTRSGYTGKKIFRLALVPVKAGEYSFLPIDFTYFNPSKQQYETLSSRPVSIQVNPAEAEETLNRVSAEPLNGSMKQRVEITGRDILPVKEELDALENQQPLSLIQFILFLMMPAMLYLMLRAFLIFTQRQDTVANLMAERASRSLKEACKLESSDEAFFSCLYRGLISAILSKAGIKGESLTYAEAESLLQRNGVSDEIAKNAAKLLEKIESAKFSGMNTDEAFKESLLSETRTMVNLLR